MSVRIQKYLANSGFGSRRKIERLILDGKIRKTDRSCYQLGDKVAEGEEIDFLGRRVSVRTADFKRHHPRVLSYHKKVGEICSRKDHLKRPLVVDNLPKIKNGKWISVGRLDINTSGLILFTDDGALAHALMHPSSNIEREYLCRVYGKVTRSMMNALRAGVRSKGEVLKFDEVERMSGKGANNWFRIVLKQGRNREIRRAWKTLGCSVNRLIRVRYGPVILSKDSSEGDVIEFGSEIIQKLVKASNTS